VRNKCCVDDDAKRAALDILRRGDLSMAQVAVRASVDRSTVLRWCREAGIDGGRALEERANRVWSKALAFQQRRRRRHKSFDDGRLRPDQKAESAG
jgi:DNA-binding MurR/RpiR family transcriptional regulator